MMTDATKNYRYECRSLEGFVQRIVVLAQRGYRWYVFGRVPEGKAPAAVDAKLLAKYDVPSTRSQRAWRKQRGEASVMNHRHGRLWLLMLTEGKHQIRRPESKELVRHLADEPIRCGPYQVDLSRDGSQKRAGEYRRRVRVALAPQEYKNLEAYLLSRATHRRVETLAAEFWALPYQAYKPVFRQIHSILRKVNERRKKAGFELVPRNSVRVFRRYPKHFDDERGSELAAGWKQSVT